MSETLGTAAAKTPGGSSFKMADHRTPLIRNCWYVAALASEVGRELIARPMLGTSVLLYRTEAGAPVALENRCVHRSFPLDKSRLEGDSVRCGYHGMRFDATGQCTDMPSLARVPHHARVRSFAVRERGPVIWVWMGDPAQADDALIPAMPWLEDPAWHAVSGYCEIDTNYIAMHENLIDHTHFLILHGDAVGTPELMRAESPVREEGDKVVMTREQLNAPVPGVFGHMMGIAGKLVDTYSDTRFESPAAHVAKTSHVYTPPDGAAQTFSIQITHLFTPTRQNQIAYWWFVSRNFRLEEQALDGFVRAGANKAFAEDRDALTWIQSLKDNAGDSPLPELSFAPDRPGMLLRKVLLRMAQAQAQPSA